jgi:hypothetical protein
MAGVLVGLEMVIMLLLLATVRELKGVTLSMEKRTLSYLVMRRQVCHIRRVANPWDVKPLLLGHVRLIAM